MNTVTARINMVTVFHCTDKIIVHGAKFSVLFDFKSDLAFQKIIDKSHWYFLPLITMLEDLIHSHTFPLPVEM